jgi:hypothetical protein
MAYSVLELCCLEEEEGSDPLTLRSRPSYIGGGLVTICRPAAWLPASPWLRSWHGSRSSLSLCLGVGCFIKRLFPWTVIFGVYALGLPQILSWRKGLLGAVSGGRAWLASLRSPASIDLLRTLQPLIKRWLNVSSSSLARAFGGEDVRQLLV